MTIENMKSADSKRVELEQLPSLSPARAAAHDWLVGSSKSWAWSSLAMQDIKLRYRGSVLGPFWLTLSMVVMVAAIGAIYSRLFGVPLSQYLPFLTIGLVLWQFISSILNEGCQTFVASQPIIQQVCMPFSVHAWRTVYRNFIVFLHCAVVVPIVLLIYPTPIDWRVVTVVPGIALLVVNAFWIAVALGMVSARYRDAPPIVASFVQVMFLVTPVFWTPESLGTASWWVPFNPLFAAIDVVRAPLLGTSPLRYSWTVLLVVTVVGMLFTLGLFARFRTRIPYWV